LFKPLSGPRRTILEMETLLPRSFHHLMRIPIINNRSLWFSWGTRFMLGWHVQQLVKIEMAFHVSEQGLLYCDSDVFFVRPFDVASLNSNGRFRFFSSPDKYKEANISNAKYVIASGKQLGIKENLFPSSAYVENLVTWHRSTVQALCTHIENVSGRSWQLALGRNVIISEYTLYGLFVDHILEDRSHLAYHHQTLCKTVWHREAMDDAALDAFCADVQDPFVALGVQSFAGIAVERLEAQLQKAITRATLADRNGISGSL
ncbi:MAG: DUF6492 family protein, partial [Aestuariivirga sp.]